jgi:hypothetical protein
MQGPAISGYCFVSRLCGTVVWVLTRKICLSHVRSWVLSNFLGDTRSTEERPSWKASCYSVKKLPALYGTLKFITAFTRAYYVSLSWARSVQSSIFHYIFLRFILTLSFHLRLGVPNGLSLSLSLSLSQVFPPEPYVHLSKKYGFISKECTQ